MLTQTESELFQMLDELATAVFRRDSSSGDPIRIMETRAALAEARQSPQATSTRWIANQLANTAPTGSWATDPSKA